MPAKTGKTLEQTYQKKTQLEHVLLRPDTYVGAIDHSTDKIHTYNKQEKMMEQRSITYCPALYKIFDEILVNAADNFQRDPKNMNEIRVWYDRKEGFIKIRNNGKTLPVKIHKEEKCYIPELVFGHLLTSDNYDDSEKKVTGGRNGYGAKLANIFSTKFQIECSDGSGSKKLYKQEFRNNMSQKDKPDIQPITGGGGKESDYTEVTFWPDFERFGMKRGMDTDICLLFERRVFDIAGATDPKVSVYLNDQKIPVTGFKDYCDLFLDDDGDKVFDQCGPRWEIGFAISANGFQQVSFVNSIATLKGGTHVNHVSDILIDAIAKKVNLMNKTSSGSKGMEIKPHHIKQHMFLFVNCLIENPAFSSQTKEWMNLKENKFGSVCKMGKKFIDQVLESGVCDRVLEWSKLKEKADLAREVKTKGNQRKLLGIPKLEDANQAGGKNSDDCTLILTEGDSAKALAVAGLSVVGRDYYGVFPLRGKPLNTRDASHQAIMKNAELQNIMKIMALDPSKSYEDTTALRYGSIMIMSDQDFDGSHIKGLIMNLVANTWPSLLKIPGFLKEFITPIVKVSRGSVTRSFYTVGEYEAWKSQNNNGKGWKSKYYKGLGTSTSTEAKEYFKNIDTHCLTFDYDAGAEEQLDLAFNKKRADDRKDWITEHVDGDYVDHTKPSLTYSEFIGKELVLYSKYDVYRAIPNLIDGLKPSQRKILFSCLKRKLTSDIKVAQLSGYVSEHAAYHHGEASLQGGIVCLAQDFVGSNNVPLLVPSGQFGTRIQGGKDSASARYIFTRLQTITRKIFHPDDDGILKYLDDDGLRVEPETYYPVIPMVLVNGGEGIGTGWSSNIPNFNPRDLVNLCRKYIAKSPLPNIPPWYRGFKGKILQSEYNPQQYECLGEIKLETPTTYRISELPIKKWTQDYKEFLQGLLPSAYEDPAKAVIQDFREYHTESTVSFLITVTPEQQESIEEKGAINVFRLRSNINLTNMVLWSPEKLIKKYESVVEIINTYCPVRLQYYGKRKKNLLVKMNRECEILRQKEKFVTMVIENELIVAKKKKQVLVEELARKGFMTKKMVLDKYFDEFSGNLAFLEENEAQVAAPLSTPGSSHPHHQGQGYDFLLSMPLYSLTQEKVNELRQQLKEKTDQVIRLENTSPEDLWDNDLQDLAHALDELDAVQKLQLQEEAKLAKQGQGRGSGKVLSKASLNAIKRAGAIKRRAAIQKETVVPEGSESESDDSPNNAGKGQGGGGGQKSGKAGSLSDEQISSILKPPTKDDAQKDFMAKLMDRQKARGIWNIASVQQRDQYSKSTIQNSAGTAVTGSASGMTGLNPNSNRLGAVNTVQKTGSMTQNPNPNSSNIYQPPQQRISSNTIPWQRPPNTGGGPATTMVNAPRPLSLQGQTGQNQQQQPLPLSSPGTQNFALRNTMASAAGTANVLRRAPEPSLSGLLGGGGSGGGGPGSNPGHAGPTGSSGGGEPMAKRPRFM